VALLLHEIDDLATWDTQHFERKAGLLEELAAIIESVVKTSIYHHLVARVNDIDLEGYFDSAREVLDLVDITVAERLALLEKKLKVNTYEWI
jgi:hypothetical protein